jgi:hypothetical protein
MKLLKKICMKEIQSYLVGAKALVRDFQDILKKNRTIVFVVI